MISSSLTSVRRACPLFLPVFHLSFAYSLLLPSAGCSFILCLYVFSSSPFLAMYSGSIRYFLSVIGAFFLSSFRLFVNSGSLATSSSSVMSTFDFERFSRFDFLSFLSFFFFFSFFSFSLGPIYCRL